MYPYPPHVPPAAQTPHETRRERRSSGHGPQPSYPQQAAPGWYPPAPHDPWAHVRGFPPHAGSYYGHPGAPVVYVPVLASAPTAPFDNYERERYIDRSTDAAIEEIRQSLRALREAIEDFADERYGS